MASQTPNDGFERYFTEKIWSMIPTVYRQEDGAAERPGVLRALVGIMARQAAVLRRSQDRLWEDSFIELCDDWAVPYLGDLLGTRMVSSLDARARRVDVAKTIYFRRRKGTIRVLEELVGDTTGWEGKVVEGFRGLARARHGLDPAGGSQTERFTATPPGGWADLRGARATRLAVGPFQEHAHMPDLRRARGQSGLWNLPKVLFYLYRQKAFAVSGVMPLVRPDGVTLTFDPSGRDVPLFMPRLVREDWDAWSSARPWELPAPMTCSLLGHAEYQIAEALIQALQGSGLSKSSAAELRRLRGIRFPDEHALLERLSQIDHTGELATASIRDAILRGALVDACGKAALQPAAVRVEPVPGEPIAPLATAACNLQDFARTVPDKLLLIDPERGRAKLQTAVPPAGSLRVAYHYGACGEIGAGTYERRSSTQPAVDITVPRASPGSAKLEAAQLSQNGVTEIVDSATYGPIEDVFGVRSLVLQARSPQRPYLRLATDWTITSAVGGEATLLLEGLWFGASGDFAIVLRGDFRQVTIRHSTLDPGGVDGDGNRLAPVRLLIEGQIDELIIDSSICGPIAVAELGQVDVLIVCDSIVQALDPKVPALRSELGELRLERVTILGDLQVERLLASDSLITGVVDVADTQHGCFRFSAALAGSALPRPFQAHTLSAVEGLFDSQRFGDPAYAQLRESAPPELLRGAESGSELGAWSRLNNPIKLESLLSKVEEFLPFGLIPCFIRQT